MKFSVGWDYWVGIGIRDMDQSNFTVNMGRNQVGSVKLRNEMREMRNNIKNKKS